MSERAQWNIGKVALTVGYWAAVWAHFDIEPGSDKWWSLAVPLAFAIDGLILIFRPQPR